MSDSCDSFDSTGSAEAAIGSPLARVAAAYAPRFAEFAFEPGFAAAVDQHVAELRDRLRLAGTGTVPGPRDAELLGDYTLGFTDVLAEIGWHEPVGYDYAVCRLTAVSWLIHEQARPAA